MGPFNEAEEGEEEAKAKGTPIMDREQWVEYLRELKDEQVEWITLWMDRTEVVFRGKRMPWLILPGLWGVISQVPLMEAPQIGINQHVPTTHGLASCECDYEKFRSDIVDHWNELSSMTVAKEDQDDSLEYTLWNHARIRDMIVPREYQEYLERNNMLIGVFLEQKRSERQLIKKEKIIQELKGKIKVKEDELEKKGDELYTYQRLFKQEAKERQEWKERCESEAKGHDRTIRDKGRKENALEKAEGKIEHLEEKLAYSHQVEEKIDLRKDQYKWMWLEGSRQWKK